MRYVKQGLIFVLLVLGGCSAKTEYAGIEGTGDTANSYGTVTGFGSIYVNGQRYLTDQAEIQVDGNPASEADLQVGMVVAIKGTNNPDNHELRAQEIHTDQALLGTIEEVQITEWTRKTLIVLGQKVRVSQETFFDGVTFTELAQGELISVGGFVSDDGVIEATYLKLMQATAPSRELEGFISNFDAQTQTLQIGELQVDFAAAELIDVPSGGLRNGLKIEVVGVQNAATGVLAAQRIRLKDELAQFLGTSSSVEGLVQVVLSDTQFLMNNQVVNLSAQTTVEPSGAEVQVGSRVVVNGYVRNDVIEAETLYLKPSFSSQFVGQITDLDAAEASLTVLDITFKVNAFTAFDDRSQSALRNFNFEDLNLGENVEVFASLRDGEWIVTRLIRRPNFGPIPNFFTGRLDLVSMDGNTLFMQGITVDVSNVDPQQLMRLRIGMFLTVIGRYTGPFLFEADSIMTFP